MNRLCFEFAISILVGNLIPFLGISSLVLSGIFNPILGVIFSFPYDVIYVFIIIRLLSIWQLRSVAQRRYQVQVHPKGQTVTFTSMGIVSENDLRKEVEYKWDTVSGFISKPDLIVVYVGQGTVIIVPKRAFQSEQEEQGFLDFVIENRKTEKRL